MAHTTETRPGTTTGSDGILLSLRIAAVASAVVVLWQFLTAGNIVGHRGVEGAEALHATGAIVLHVVTGLAALAAIAAWRLRGLPVWPAVLAAVVFVLTFAQAYAGSHGVMAVHVPGAMIVTVGTVVLAAWSLRPGIRA